MGTETSGSRGTKAKLVSAGSSAPTTDVAGTGSESAAPAGTGSAHDSGGHAGPPRAWSTVVQGCPQVCRAPRGAT